MDSPGRQIKLGLAAFAYLFGLAIITHVPVETYFSDSAINFDIENWEDDKLYHAIAYAILSALFSALPLVRVREEEGDQDDAVWMTPERICGIGLIAAALACVGLIDELTQPWVGRSCSMDDWVADMVGIAIGQALAVFVCLCTQRSRTDFRPLD